jgi:hypothetical protein
LRILIVTQYFWPENFRINDIAKYLIKKNFKVDVLTGEPNYPSGYLSEDYILNRELYNKYNNINIFRVPIILRRGGSQFNLFLNYASFIVSGIFFGLIKLRNREYDLIFTFGTSPITSAIPAVFISKIKRVKHILWVLDIWPDILKDLKYIKNRFLYQFISYTVKYIYKNCDKILVQSKGFIKIVKKYNKLNKILYFPSWPEKNQQSTHSILEKEKEFIKKNFKKYSFKIVFTGNIGEAQNFDNILKAANILKDNKSICWIIVGTGRKIFELKLLLKNLKINNFYFIGPREQGMMKLYHQIADILLVSLTGGNSLSQTIPGKVQTYLQSNKYILGFIKGETVNIIKESKVGEAVNPTNWRLLAKRINYLEKHRSIVQNVFKKKYGLNYANKIFKQKYLFETIWKLFSLYPKKSNEIKLILDTKKLPYKKNFTLSGLNLAFLGYWSANKILLHKNIYHWPDGLFYKRFFNSNITKIPGREIISNLNLPNFIKKIYVLGSLSSNSKSFLKKRYNKELIHINLPVGEPLYLYNIICKIEFNYSDLIIITLPTPKQEQLSEIIANNSKYYKIICIGGAISMASGDEKLIPKFLEENGLEFIWRLRTDTKRRIFRLIYTASYYLISELKFFYNKINCKIIN